MSKSFLFVFQILFLSGFVQAESIFSRPGSWPGLYQSIKNLRDVGPKFGSQTASWLGISAAVRSISEFFQKNVERAEDLEAKAKTRFELKRGRISTTKAYLQQIKERNDRIAELRKKILETQRRVSMETETSVEDLTTELLELLAEEARPDLLGVGPEFAKVWNIWFESEQNFIEAQKNSGSYGVPGIWQLAPKKRDKKSTEGTSPPSTQEASAAQTQPGESDALQVASTSVANTVMITVQTPTGAHPIRVPPELQPVFLALHTENMALKTENAAIKAENQEIKQRLQRETDRSSLYERDHQQLIERYAAVQLDVQHLTKENDLLHAEIQRLREENGMLRQENEEMKRGLLEARERLDITEQRLSSVEEQLRDVQYHMEIAEALNYINIGARNAFGLGRFGAGFVAIAKKASMGQMNEQESQIWADFVRQHPNAADPEVVEFVETLLNGRVMRAHPSVKKLTREQLTQRLRFLLGDEEALIKKVLDLIWSFPV